MPSSPLNLPRIRRNILACASLGVFCVAMITAAVLAYPLYLKQRDYSHASLEHVAQLEAVTIGEYVRRLEEISLQITSRTRARQVLDRYNRQEISEQTAQKALTAILSDALNRGEEVMGIQRLDGNHNHLLAVGETIDPLYWPPAPSLEEGLTLTGPVAINMQWRLAVRALIRMPGQKEPAGTDIVSFSSEGLAAILAQGFEGIDAQAVLAARVNGEWRFLQGQESGHLVDQTGNGVAQRRPLFNKHVVGADRPVVYYEDSEFGYAASRIPDTDWYVLVRASVGSLYGDLYDSMRLALAVAVILAACGAILTFILIRPLSGLLERQASELADHVAEKTRDVTDLTEELEAARARAEETARVKSRYLSTTAHELHAPLTALQGYASLLRKPTPEDCTPERISYYGRQLYDASEQLLAMAESLLDFSKIDSGEARLRPETVSLHDVLGSAMRKTAAAARARGLEMHMDIKSRLHVIEADREALLQMVANLLSNAVKFTDPPGKIVLTVREDEEGHMLIEVADTGIGMSPQDLEKALQPFEQVDGKLKGHYPGTGLGLAVVGGLMELHGGQLEIDSAPGSGTTARLVFPRQEAMAA